MARDLSSPLAALSVAMDVISGYQYDIRTSRDSIGVDLEKRGFCGGAFYRNATLELRQALHRFQQEADTAAEEAERSPSPAPGTEPLPVPPNPYPLRDGTERAQAQAQLVKAQTALHLLEPLVSALNEPALWGYVGVCITALAHLARTLKQSPNPYPLDEQIIGKGKQQ